MKKRQIITAILALLLVGLCACGSAPKVDTGTLPEAILNGVSFVDELVELDAGSAANVYNIPEGVQARVFWGSGATAEEIAVFEAPDAETAEAMLANAKTHITERIAAFENYIPEQVALLEDAIVKQIGNCVIVCVAEDTAAVKKIIG